MSIIRTVKELKDVIKDLPDDMLVDGYTSGGYSAAVDYFIMTEDMLSEEEIRDGYPDGFKDKIMISVGD